MFVIHYRDALAASHRERLSHSLRLGAEPDRAMWKKAHKLYVQAFQEPPTDAEKKRLAKLLKKPLPQDIADMFFDYEAFLRGLGRMSLSELPLSSLS